MLNHNGETFIAYQNVQGYQAAQNTDPDAFNATAVFDFRGMLVAGPFNAGLRLETTVDGEIHCRTEQNNEWADFTRVIRR